MSAAAIVTLVVRYGLVMLFLPFSALDKIFGFDGAVKQAQEVFKPRAIAIAVLMCGASFPQSARSIQRSPLSPTPCASPIALRSD